MNINTYRLIRQHHIVGINLNDPSVLFAKRLQIVHDGIVMIQHLGNQLAQVVVPEPVPLANQQQDVAQLRPNLVDVGLILLDGADDFRLAGVCVVEGHTDCRWKTKSKKVAGKTYISPSVPYARGCRSDTRTA